MVAKPNQIDEDGSELERDELGGKHFEQAFLSLQGSNCGILEKGFDLVGLVELSSCID